MWQSVTLCNRHSVENEYLLTKQLIYESKNENTNYMRDETFI